MSQLFEGISKVKLRGGVVGKVSIVLICVSISMAIIAWSVSMVWVSVLALILVFTLCFPLLWRLVSFADHNPQAALLEGAEFLVHEQMRLGMKSLPILPDSGALPLPAPKPVVIEDAQTAALPDSEASRVADPAPGTKSQTNE
ncbi:MAG: hypothetical protein ABSD29_21700 [Verrucomicrobiota bacterium]